jgi:hypothetical protein
MGSKDDGFDYIGLLGDENIGLDESDAIRDAFQHGGVSREFVKKGGGQIAWASGAGASSCHAVGMTIWHFLFFATVLALIFFTPRAITYIKRCLSQRPERLSHLASSASRLLHKFRVLLYAHEDAGSRPASFHK